MIFLEASDAALLRRFSETRRPHPLAPTGSVIEGILAERARLRRIKKMADKVLDTSDLTVHELRRAFRELSQGDGKQTRLTVTLLSFGYKYGVPAESDLLFDVRFLPNPHFVTGLRQLTGKDQTVRDYVAAAEATTPFLDMTTDLLRFPDSAVHHRREELPHDRDRLHRRASPVGRDRRAAEDPARRHYRRTVAGEAS